MKSLLALILTTLLSVPAHSQELIKTGVGVRHKKFAFFSFDVYQITHFIRTLPPQGVSRTSLATADEDKRLELVFLRDVEVSKITESLLTAYQNCDYKDEKKTREMLAVFKKDLKKGEKIVIDYQKLEKKTTLSSPDGGSLTILGDEIMLATWCIWFGKGTPDQPKLGDALTGN